MSSRPAIPDAENPLDNSAVHPESYGIVAKMAKGLNADVVDLMKSDELRKQLNLNDYITDKFGIPTLKDIVSELEKPGLDPRDKIRVFEFDATIKTMEDIKVGMIVNGVVTNITRFGAFVDIGIKENGLIHVSNMSDKFIDDPNKVVKLNQHLKVLCLIQCMLSLIVEQKLV